MVYSYLTTKARLYLLHSLRLSHLAAKTEKSLLCQNCLGNAAAAVAVKTVKANIIRNDVSVAQWLAHWTQNAKVACLIPGMGFFFFFFFLMM